MKNLAFLLIGLMLLAACESEITQPAPASVSTKTLKLASYRVSFAQTPAIYTGDAMPMQETYVLKDAANFSKTRVMDGVTTTVSGTYTKTTLSGNEYYILVFDSADEHVCTHSGSSANQERLKITQTGAENFTSAYDGPDLTYEWAQ